jgi:Myb-like DNA-binding domain
MAVQHRGSKWTPEEDRRLLDLVKDRKSWVFISANLKRPAKTAKHRFAYLGAKQKTTMEK